jgi:Mechanosensitive ion channel
MSGISIFVTQPFVVGDIVDIKQGQSVIVSGTVARISPLRTTFLDENSQAVTLPNKQLSDLIITNHGDVGLSNRVCSADFTCLKSLLLILFVPALEVEGLQEPCEPV